MRRIALYLLIIYAVIGAWTGDNYRRAYEDKPSLQTSGHISGFCWDNPGVSFGCISSTGPITPEFTQKILDRLPK